MNFDNISLETPLFVYDLDSIRARLQMLRATAEGTPLQILYSIKSASFIPLLQAMVEELDGFATSSLFESRIAHQVLNGKGATHLSTVILQEEQIDELVNLCDHINVNSLTQWGRYGRLLSDRVECGIRINPLTNYVKDPRFDPCRSGSKLGVPLGSLLSALSEEPGLIDGVHGLQFHNNCESNNLQQLVETCRKLVKACSGLLERVDWINIGGGYLFNEESDMQGLVESVQILNATGVEKIFFEPGKAIVGDTGYLVSSVVDLFSSEGKDIAILDCSVNHLPEVFEFQYQPEIYPQVNGGNYEYRLSGMTCLSGDLFGDYCFDRPLTLGDRIVFRDVGAYMYVKASMFNGINIPSVYMYERNGGLRLIKEHGFKDFQDRQT